jgi:hypothetical protein
MNTDTEKPSVETHCSAVAEAKSSDLLARVRLTIGRLWVVLTSPIVLLLMLVGYVCVHIGWFVFVWVPVWASGGASKVPDWMFRDEPWEFSFELTRRYVRFFC